MSFFCHDMSVWTFSCFPGFPLSPLPLHELTKNRQSFEPTDRLDESSLKV